MDSRATYVAAVASAVEQEIATFGYSVKSLADTTGIPRATLQRRLLGVSPFTSAELALIGQALGVAPSRFLIAAETAA